jgi:hypothetical protein
MLDRLRVTAHWRPVRQDRIHARIVDLLSGLRHEVQRAVLHQQFPLVWMGGDPFLAPVFRATAPWGSATAGTCQWTLSARRLHGVKR